MAHWPDSLDGQIAGYGVKLMPGLGRLRDRVQPRQLDVFRDYGYPKQWWRDEGPYPSRPPVPAGGPSPGTMNYPPGVVVTFDMSARSLPSLSRKNAIHSSVPSPCL